MSIAKENRGSVRNNHLAISHSEAWTELLSYLNPRSRTPEQTLEAKLKALHRSTEAIARISWRDEIDSTGTIFSFESIERDLFGPSPVVHEKFRAYSWSSSEDLVKTFQESVMRYV